MTGADDPSFVHRVAAMPPGADIDVAADLSPDELAEVNARCDEFARARAEAEMTGRDYLIH